MQPGALAMNWQDRPSAFARFDELCDREAGGSGLPLALRYFGGAGREHMAKCGTRLETFAKVRAKASRHAANNPLALLRKEITVDDVMQSPALWPGVMTRLMACPPTCGAAAAIVVSAAFAARHRLTPGVQILGQAMATDRPDTFQTNSMIDLVGFNLSASAAAQVYEQTGIGPGDVDVCELHDCFAQNELISYEALGLCAVGEAERFVDEARNTYGDDVVVNPSSVMSRPCRPGSARLGPGSKKSQPPRATDRLHRRVGPEHGTSDRSACLRLPGQGLSVIE